MPIATACPQCRQPLTAPDDSQGKQLRCPKCNGVFIVNHPGSLEATAVPQAAPVVSLAPGQHGVFTCPYCRATVPPIVSSKVTTTAVVLCVILALGICTLPFCWIPLVFMKEDVRNCGSCGIKLG